MMQKDLLYEYQTPKENWGQSQQISSTLACCFHPCYLQRCGVGPKASCGISTACGKTHNEGALAYNEGALAKNEGVLESNEGTAESDYWKQ